MEIEFEEDYLREIYENGKASNKKHRYQPQVVKQYIKAINTIRPLNKIEDLFPFKSLNYEKLTGDKKGLEAIKVNDQYRIEFVSRIEGENPNSITICSITELSNHYKKK